MKAVFDEERTIRALDRLFRENEEVKARLAILERLVNQLADMKELCHEEENKPYEVSTREI